MRIHTTNATAASEQLLEQITGKLKEAAFPGDESPRQVAVRNQQGEVCLVAECTSEAEFVGATIKLEMLGLRDERPGLGEKVEGYDALFTIVQESGGPAHLANQPRPSTAA